MVPDLAEPNFIMVLAVKNKQKIGLLIERVKPGGRDDEFLVKLSASC